MKFLSLFSGAGGLDIGLEMSGMECDIAVELDSDACETLRRNGIAKRVIEGSVVDICATSLREEYGV